MKIGVFGLGYIGLIATACLTSQGHRVIAIDISDKKIRQLKDGQTPISEPGLDEMLKSALTKGLLSCFTEVPDEFQECEAAFVCVGTPGGADGAHNMSYIAEVTRQIAESIGKNRKRPLTLIYRSTMRPGTIDELIWPLIRTHINESAGVVDIVYNPEFLREANGIHDYLHPPKIVIGTIDGLPNKCMDSINSDMHAPVFYTRYKEAELTKFVDNTFHALKVSFANEIGRICMQMNLSAAKVHEIFVSDTKLNISATYLRPGGPFGGSCLPKDVRALQHMASDIRASTHLIDSLISTNEAHKAFLLRHVTKDLKRGATVLMLGLAFKYGSDDLRESPKIDMAHSLLQEGYALSIYDPFLDAGKLIGQNLGYGFSHLPNLPKLMVSLDVIQRAKYDLVIDTNGTAGKLSLNAVRIVDINTII